MEENKLYQCGFLFVPEAVDNNLKSIAP